MPNPIAIVTPAELGRVVRAARRAARMRLDDFAGAAGLSAPFVGDLERGKPTAQLGRALHVLQELGVRVLLDVPEGTHEALAALEQRPVKRKPRKTTRTRGDAKS